MQKTAPSLLPQKILASCVSFILITGALEAVVRVRDAVKASKEELVWVGEKGFLNIRSDNPRLVYEYRPNTSVDLFGTTITTNSHGYRDYPRDLTKPEGVRRIAILGDSIAFGFRVGIDETYGKLLEKNLRNSPGNPVEVLNMGVAGYNTAQEAELFETRGILFNPDLVILNYSLNDKDLFADGGLSGYFMKTATPLHLLGLLKYKWLKYRESKTDIGERQVISGLDRIKAICAQRNIPVIVMVHPMFREAWPKERVRQHIEWILNLSRDRGFYVLDLSEAFSGQDPEKVSVDPLHPSALGHRITAEALENFLREKKLLPKNQNK